MGGRGLISTGSWEENFQMAEKLLSSVEGKKSVVH